MITKLRIDNFRCFTNFELELGALQLFLGHNGGGKTSVFDLLARIRSLLEGQKATEVFEARDLTAWDMRKKQTFSVQMADGDDEYRYDLEIEHKLDEGKLRISREELVWKGQTFYLFQNGEAHLYRLRGDVVEEGAQFPFDWTQSFIPLIPERNDNGPLIRFRDAVGRWFFVAIVPSLMETFSKVESPGIYRNASNFCDWYRSLSQSNPEIIARLGESLKPVIPNFLQMQYQLVGDAKALQAKFDNMSVPLLLFQLSDGQRVLIVLYTMLAAMQSLGMDLYIDEPDNYVNLREIQPWLHGLQDTAEDSSSQVIIISHHPEIIDDMAEASGKWFSRSDNGPAQVGKYPKAEGLSSSETMARGWHGE